MSSAYKLLCLAHEPAIVLDIETHDPAVAVTAALDRASVPALAEHQGCDLMIGRYSYPLIEIGCPGAGGPQTGGSGCFHPRHAKWLSVNLARVLLAAHDSPDPMIHKAAEGVDRCWSPARLVRLRHEINPPVVS